MTPAKVYYAAGILTALAVFVWVLAKSVAEDGRLERRDGHCVGLLWDTFSSVMFAFLAALLAGAAWPVTVIAVSMIPLLLPLGYDWENEDEDEDEDEEEDGMP